MTNLPLVLRFMLVAAAVSIVTEQLRVPYTVALVVAGLVIGNIHLGPPVAVSPDVLLTLLIPPLLYEGGLRLPAAHLRSYWGPIAVLAIPGTIVTAAALGSLGAAVFHLGPRTALLLGVIVSAIDPVSVQALVREMGLDLRLGTLLDGEAILNDGVAIVLFAIVSTAAVSAPLALFLRFVWLVGGGVLVGGLVAFATAYAMGSTQQHLVEALGSLIAALGALLAADSVGASGVIAVVAAGVVFANYGPRHLTDAGLETVSTLWDVIAFLANSVLYLLIGLAVPAGLLAQYWPLVVGLALGGLVVRAAIVYGTAAAWRGRPDLVPAAWRPLLTWGGLRGGVAIALALGLPRGMPGRDAVVAGTFGMVIFTLLVQGSTARPVLRWSGLLPAAVRAGG